jgi:hypothetical protein
VLCNLRQTCFRRLPDATSNSKLHSMAPRVVVVAFSPRRDSLYLLCTGLLPNILPFRLYFDGNNSNTVIKSTRWTLYRKTWRLCMARTLHFLALNLTVSRKCSLYGNRPANLACLQVPEVALLFRIPFSVCHRGDEACLLFRNGQASTPNPSCTAL